MSGDTVSSSFPDRPIRPLPRRRLRERLSPEVAESIQYPPAPPKTAPVFSYPYSLHNDDADSGLASTQDAAVEPVIRYTSDRPAALAGMDHGEASVRINLVSRALPDPASRFARPTDSTVAGPSSHQHLNVHPPLSGASSTDGYESLESNNNKKKRKIPAAGDPALHGVHVMVDASGTTMLSANGTLMDRSAAGTEAASASSPYGCSAGGSFPSGAHHVAGSGRGRYGRIRNGRSPLQTVPDSTANFWASRYGKSRWIPAHTESTGIISTAIANANAEKIAPREGQENISLLHQQLAAKPASTPGQFTFTVDKAQIPGAGALAWPSADMMGQYPPYHAPPAAGPSASTRAAYSMPPPPPAASADLPGSTVPGGAGQQHPPQQGGTRKPGRRDVEKELAAAAKKRRRETLLQNRRRPPKPEEVWICNFCEYESIWGSPPQALVRQYEKKAREQRKKAKARKKHLETLKKSRQKSKKPTRGSAAPRAPTVPDAGQATTAGPSQVVPGSGRHAHVEDYVEAIYDDGGEYSDAVPQFEPQPGDGRGTGDPPPRRQGTEDAYDGSSDEAPLAAKSRRYRAG